MELSVGDIRNVRDFGAVGDGNTDDTDAIQAAIDSSIDQTYTPLETTRRCLGRVYIPSGFYKITKPLKIHSVLGFYMYGDGASTVLLPVGKFDSVLDINGAAWCEWNSFRIDGNGLAEVNNVISLEWERDVVNRSTSQCRFSHIDIMGFKSFVNGFSVGRLSGNDQVDCSYFEHCCVSGRWVDGDTELFQNAFLIGSGVHGNNLCHTIIHPIFAGCRYLINSMGVAPLTIIGGSFGDAESVFRWQTSGTLTSIGARAETCQRLYVDDVVAGWDSCVLIQNFMFVSNNLHKDNVLVKWNTGGRLKLDGVQIAGGGPDQKPVINVASWAATVIDLDGVNCYTDPKDIVKIVGGRKECVNIICKGYRKITNKGSIFTEYSNFILGDIKILGNVSVDGDIGGNSIGLSDTERWNKEGFFLDEERFWIKDGFFPGPQMLIKCQGAGTIVARQNGNLDWVNWEVNSNNSRDSVNLGKFKR